MELTAGEIANLITGTVLGDPEVKVSKIAPLEEADDTSISFLAHPKYQNLLNETNAGVVLIGQKFNRDLPSDKTFIKVPDVYAALANILAKFHPNPETANKAGISDKSFISDAAHLGKEVYAGPFSYIDDDVQIGDNVKIFPNAYIGPGSKIGSNSVIYPGVTIYANSLIDENCIIHSGSVIGSDGFGFVPLEDGTYQKIPQTGNVIIGKNVEIGANTTIDKATLTSTKINDGAKIDNLVQIAHNVEIGSNTVIVAQTGISGSSKIGKNSQIGGQVGIVGHITIADKTQIGAKSGVGRNIKEPGKQWHGIPAEQGKEAFKIHARTKQLPAMEEKLTRLENEVKILKEALAAKNTT